MSLGFWQASPWRVMTDDAEDQALNGRRLASIVTYTGQIQSISHEEKGRCNRSRPDPGPFSLTLLRCRAERRRNTDNHDFLGYKHNHDG
jgi:hypothetical protein